MDSGSLYIYLFMAGAGASLVWILARLVCLKLMGIPFRPDSQSVEHVYFMVLALRIGGLLFCLAALLAWLQELTLPLCLTLAAGGCWLQYLAYRKRTNFALGLSRQKQADMEECHVSPATGNA